MGSHDSPRRVDGDHTKTLRGVTGSQSTKPETRKRNLLETRIDPTPRSSPWGTGCVGVRPCSGDSGGRQTGSPFRCASRTAGSWRTAPPPPASWPWFRGSALRPVPSVALRPARAARFARAVRLVSSGMEVGGAAAPGPPQSERSWEGRTPQCSQARSRRTDSP